MTDAAPFTILELVDYIEEAEQIFRSTIRLSIDAADNGRLSDQSRLLTRSAETASILAELRYQRDRLASEVGS